MDQAASSLSPLLEREKASLVPLPICLYPYPRREAKYSSPCLATLFHLQSASSSRKQVSSHFNLDPLTDQLFKLSEEK